MTGGIAHDFNNVIAMANASLALAEKYVEEPSHTRQHIQSARGALDRGAALTGRLLTFARRRSFEVETADLNEMLLTFNTTVWNEPETSATLKPGSYIRLQVRDTGTGMSAADLERAFEPLFTTKGGKGTGLGLAQVYGFMRHIGGDARISSQLGVGTTVDLLFPCRPEATTC
jgi:signal transduction histidine kinase